MLALAALPIAVHAQVLATGTVANNGSGGVFMDLTAATQNLNVLSFDTFFAAVAGTAGSVEVYVKSGTYVGSESTAANWTLSQTVGFTSAGTTTLANLLLSTPIALTAGQTTGVYLHGITVGNALRYNGTTALPPTTTVSNADLTMFSSNTRTGAVAFGGSLFTPRTFAGNINYAPVPEPASLAALGLGALAMVRRRRR